MFAWLGSQTPKPIEAAEVTVSTGSDALPKARRSSVMRMIQQMEAGVELQPPIAEPKPAIKIGPIKVGRTLRVAGKAIANLTKSNEPAPTPSRKNNKKVSDLLTALLCVSEYRADTDR